MIRVTDTGSTITVITDGDTLVFTKATYGASVVSSNEIMVKIQETNLLSTIYSDCMFVSGSGSSDMSGNTYSAENIDTDYDWYPLTADAYSNRTERTEQYQDVSLTPTDGTIVTSISGLIHRGSGFFDDGSQHITVNGSGEIKYTVDTTRHKKVDVIHDFPLQSGDPDNPTDESGSTVLPYGAHFIGNYPDGSDISLAHEDITTFVNCSQTNGDPVDIGSGNVTVSGVSYGTGCDGVENAAVLIDSNLDQFSFSANHTDGTFNGSVGSICGWYKKTGSDISGEYLFDHSLGSGFSVFRDGVNNTVRFRINGYYANFNLDIWDGIWHFIRFTWSNPPGLRRCQLDGVWLPDVAGGWTYFQPASGEIHLGRRNIGVSATTGYFQNWCITSNPNTPQIPTANGVPLHAPVKRDNITQYAHGDGYQVAWNGSEWVIVHDDTLGASDIVHYGVDPQEGSTILPISGNFGAVANILGSASKKIQTTGLIDATGNLVSLIGVKKNIPGSVNEQAETSGLISVKKTLSGALNCSADVSSSISIMKNLSGSVDSIPELSGQIHVLKSLSGSVDASAEISGLISVKKSLSGDLDCSADISSSISILKKLSGSFDSVSDVQGLITISELNKIRLSGNIGAMSALAGAISVKKGLTGQIQAIPGIDGRISIKINLSGSVDAIASVIGQLRLIGETTLGVIIDPSIDSVTIKRLLESITVTREIESVTTKYSIESI